jgi:hypothetical protein
MTNGLRVWATTALLGMTVLGCGESDVTTAATGGSTGRYRLDTTRLCALVPARDAAVGSMFPQDPPVKVFGTDLGWTYEHNGTVTMIFGDSWQRIDICPLQPSDDSLATLAVPPNDWPGYSAHASLPDSQCPELTFALDAKGTSFAPIELKRWDGVAVPLGPNQTPVTAFHDGQREWALFIVAGGQVCSRADAMNGATCPTTYSAQAADLVCGLLGALPLCHDPTSTKRDAGTQAYYLHIAERTGPTSYVTRAMFLTNKYLNITARAVRAFDPSNPQRNDYTPGTGALLMWGRPGFDELSHDGEAPPYFMYHSLPFQLAGDRITFEPRYLRNVSGGVPSFSTSQAEATPLYTGEFEPVNHAAVSYLGQLERWLMVYGGNSVDFVNQDGTAGQTQPIPGALYARFSTQPWGPWSNPEPILTEEQVAQDMVCGKRAPAGCLPPPTPRIRPACIEAADPHGGGALYGANIIDTMTRSSRAETGRGPAVDVFWNVSTWHPYSVVLVKTHIESE